MPLDTFAAKEIARREARQHRAILHNPTHAQSLIRHIPAHWEGNNIIAGFAPIGSEINAWPLLHHLHAKDHKIALPIVKAPKIPLTFRQWEPNCEMSKDRYGVKFPTVGKNIVPSLVLVPLLAFTRNRDRLGYGGGYYDRTLAALRRDGEVFACGVAYAGQEVAELPTDAHDAKLDGILTENGFRTFR